MTFESKSPLNIAVAGTGYVGLSIATLLAQHNHVMAVDIIPEKVELIIVCLSLTSWIPMRSQRDSAPVTSSTGSAPY